MSVLVYRNDGSGGPVDERTAYATLADTATTWTDPAALAPGSDVRYRLARTDGTGAESLGRSAEVRVRTDSAGLDATGRPGPAVRVRATPFGPGAIRLDWLMGGPAAGPAPTEFHVRCQPGAIDFGLAPNRIVPAVPTGGVGPLRGRGYGATLAGLTPGASYRVSVRPSNAAGECEDVSSLATVAGSALVAAPDGTAAGATATGDRWAPGILP